MAEEQSGASAGSLAVYVGLNMEQVNAGVPALEKQLGSVKTLNITPNIKPIGANVLSSANKQLADGLKVSATLSSITGVGAAVTELKRDFKARTKGENGLVAGVRFDAGSAITSLQKQLDSHTFKAKVDLVASGKTIKTGPTGNQTEDRGIGFRSTSMRNTPQASSGYGPLGMAGQFYNGPRPSGGNITGGSGVNALGGGLSANDVARNLVTAFNSQIAQANKQSGPNSQEASKAIADFRRELSTLNQAQLEATRKRLLYDNNAAARRGEPNSPQAVSTRMMSNELTKFLSATSTATRGINDSLRSLAASAREQGNRQAAAMPTVPPSIPPPSQNMMSGGASYHGPPMLMAAPTYRALPPAPVRPIPMLASGGYAGFPSGTPVAPVPDRYLQQSSVYRGTSRALAQIPGRDYTVFPGARPYDGMGTVSRFAGGGPIPSSGTVSVMPRTDPGVAFQNAIGPILNRAMGILGRKTGASIESRITDMEGAARRHFFSAMTLTTAFTLPAVAVAKTSVSSAVDFQKRMALTGALTDFDKNEIGTPNGPDSRPGRMNLSKEVLNMSTRLPQTAKELADALYFVGSTGLKASDALYVMDRSATAAAGGLGEAGKVAQFVTSVLAAYNLDARQAGRVTDVLTAAVRVGKGEAKDYASAMGKVIPIAATLGVSVEEVAANLATMTKAGFTANQAATALTHVMSKLSAPTAKGGKILAGMGTSAEQLREGMKKQGLMNVLGDIMEKSGGNVETLRPLMGNIYGLNNILVTAGRQAQSYSQNLMAMKNSAGDTNDAMKVMSETVDFQWNRLKNSIARVGIDVASKYLPDMANAAEKLATGMPDYVNKISASWNALPEPVQRVAKAMGTLLVLAGPVKYFQSLLLNLGTVFLGLRSALMFSSPLPWLALAAAGMVAIQMQSGGASKAVNALTTDLSLAGIATKTLVAATIAYSGLKVATTFGVIANTVKLATTQIWALVTAIGALSAAQKGGYLKDLAVGGSAYAVARNAGAITAAKGAAVPVGSMVMGYGGNAIATSGAASSLGTTASAAMAPAALAAVGASIAVIAAAVMSAVIYLQEYNRESEDIENRNHNLAMSANNVADAFERASKFSYGSAAIRTGLSDLQAQFDKGKDSEGSLTALLPKIEKERGLVLKAKINTGDKVMILREYDNIKRQIESRVIELRVKPVTSWDAFKEDMRNGIADTFSGGSGNTGMPNLNWNPLSWLGTAGAGVSQAGSNVSNLLTGRGWRGEGMASNGEGFDQSFRRVLQGTSSIADNQRVKLEIGEEQFAKLWNTKPKDQILNAQALARAAGVTASKPGSNLSQGEKLMGQTLDGLLGGRTGLAGKNESQLRDVISKMTQPQINQIYKQFDKMGIDKATQVTNAIGVNGMELLASRRQEVRAEEERKTMYLDGVDPASAADAKLKLKALTDLRTSYNSYQGVVDGLTGKIREFGEKTEYARVKNEMMKASLKGVSEEFKNVAINAAKSYDAMKGFNGIKDSLSSVVEQGQQRLMSFGMTRDPNAALLRSAEKGLNYNPIMEALQKSTLSNLTPIQSMTEQIVAKLDEIVEELRNPTPVPGGATAPLTPTTAKEALFAAISGQETGGTKDPTKATSSVGALGKYQIMPANFVGKGGWDKEALGRDITAAEYKNSPEIQERMGKFKLGQFYDRNLAKANGDTNLAVKMTASEWYSGSPTNYNSTKPVSSGPTIKGYSDSVLGRFQTQSSSLQSHQTEAVGFASYGIPMWNKVGDTVGKQCGATLTHFLNQSGFKGSASSMARDKSYRVQANADGSYAPGTMFHFRGGTPGYKNNHYAMVGPDGKHWLESNWAGKGQKPNMITANRAIDWRRDTFAATWKDGVHAFAPKGVGISGNKLPNTGSPAMESAQTYIKGVLKGGAKPDPYSPSRFDGSLGLMTAPGYENVLKALGVSNFVQGKTRKPDDFNFSRGKDWGTPVKEHENTVVRFALQSKIMSREFLDAYALLPKAMQQNVDKAIKALHTWANATDFTFNREKANKQAGALMGETAKTGRMLGRESSLFAQLNERNTYGDTAYASPEYKEGMERGTFNNLRAANSREFALNARANAARIAQFNMANGDRPEYGQYRQQLAAKQFEVWNNTGGSVYKNFNEASQLDSQTMRGANRFMQGPESAEDVRRRARAQALRQQGNILAAQQINDFSSEYRANVNRSIQLQKSAVGRGIRGGLEVNSNTADMIGRGYGGRRIEEENKVREFYNSTKEGFMPDAIKKFESELTPAQLKDPKELERAKARADSYAGGLASQLAARERTRLQGVKENAGGLIGADLIDQNSADMRLQKDRMAGALANPNTDDAVINNALLSVKEKILQANEKATDSEILAAQATQRTITVRQLAIDGTRSYTDAINKLDEEMKSLGDTTGLVARMMAIFGAEGIGKTATQKVDELSKNIGNYTQRQLADLGATGDTARMNDGEKAQYNNRKTVEAFDAAAKAKVDAGQMSPEAAATASKLLADSLGKVAQKGAEVKAVVAGAEIEKSLKSQSLALREQLETAGAHSELERSRIAFKYELLKLTELEGVALDENTRKQLEAAQAELEKGKAEQDRMARLQTAADATKSLFEKALGQDTVKGFFQTLVKEWADSIRQMIISAVSAQLTNKLFGGPMGENPYGKDATNPVMPVFEALFGSKKKKDDRELTEEEKEARGPGPWKDGLVPHGPEDATNPAAAKVKKGLGLVGKLLGIDGEEGGDGGAGNSKTIKANNVFVQADAVYVSGQSQAGGKALPLAPNSNSETQPNTGQDWLAIAGNVLGIAKSFGLTA